MTRFQDSGHRRPLDRNRIVVLAIVLIVAIFALWAITAGAIRFLGPDDEKNPTTAPSRTAQPTVGATGPAIDGDLEMRLTSVRSTGPRELTVVVTVTNRTSAFVSFYGEGQQVISTESQTVRSGVQLVSLEPKESTPVTLRFALPADFQADELDLHSTPSSPGARIPLG